MKKLQPLRQIAKIKFKEMKGSSYGIALGSQCITFPFSFSLIMPYGVFTWSVVIFIPPTYFVTMCLVFRTSWQWFDVGMIFDALTRGYYFGIFHPSQEHTPFLVYS